MADRTVEVKLVFDDAGALRSMQFLDKSTQGFGTSMDRTSSAGIISFGKLAGSFFAADAALRIITGTLGSIKQLLIDVGTQAFETTRSFETKGLAIQAILANQLQLSENAAENFTLAGDFADQAILRLIDLDRKSQATFDQLLKGFQIVAAQGGLRYVSSLEEALQLTTLLVNSTLTLDTQLNKELALQTNITAMLQGQMNARAEVVRSLGLSGEQLKEILATAEKEKNLYETLVSGPLSGMEQASENFAQTWEGILSTSETLRDLFLRAAFEQAFDELQKGALQVIGTIDRNRTEILNFVKLIGGSVAQAAVLIVDLGDLTADFFRTKVGQKAIEYVQTKLYDLFLTLRFFINLLESRDFSLVGVGLALGLAHVQVNELKGDLEAAMESSRQKVDDVANSLLNWDLSRFLRDLGSANTEVDRLAKGIRVIEIGPGFRRIVEPPSLLTPQERAMRALTAPGAERAREAAVGGIPMALGGAGISPEAMGGAAPTLPAGILEPTTGGVEFDVQKFEGTSVALLRIQENAFAARYALQQLVPPEMFEDLNLGLEKLDNFQRMLSDYAGIFQDAFFLMAQGVRSGGVALVAALAKVTGMILAKIGTHLLGQGLAEIALGSAPPPFGPRPDLIAHGTYLKATGATLIGIGAAVGAAGTVAGAVAGGTGRGGESGSAFNPVYTRETGQAVLDLAPRSSVQVVSDLKAEIRRLNVKISSMSPGDVVTVGTAQSGGLSALSTPRDTRNFRNRNFDEPLVE